MRDARRIRLVLAVAGTACLLMAGLAFAQQEGQSPQMNDEMMQAYMKAAQPGPEHEHLAQGAGVWNCTVRSWMDPSAEPMVSSGTEQAEMVLGGRFLRSHFEGTMMEMPFEGLGLIGYDNVKKKYVGIWTDSMSTGIMSYEGDYDPQKKEMVCKGQYMDAMTGQPTTATLITRELGPDHHVFEMWSPGPDGKDVKWMEMDYQRAK